MTLKLLILCACDANGNMPFIEAFQRALATPDVPAKTGYWLSKIWGVCQSEAATFEKVRAQKIKELGTPDEPNPDKFLLSSEAMTKFADEMNSLERDIDLGVPADLKLKLPPVFTPADWQPLIELGLFEEPA